MGAAAIAAVGINVSTQGRVHGWMTQELKASGGAVSDARRYHGSSPENEGTSWIRARGRIGVMLRAAQSMIRDLADRTPSFQQPKELVIRRVIDPTEFRDTAHPAIGPLTTSLRRTAFERMRALLSQPSARTRDYVAWLNGTPVGAIEAFVGSKCAGIHGLTVTERYQGRGIASALIERACIDVRDLGAKRIGLLASTEGQRLYVRRGFHEVARFGYWYRSFQRDC
jgi:GNAT superfamily N-acetyltransferase